MANVKNGETYTFPSVPNPAHVTNESNQETKFIFIYDSGEKPEMLGGYASQNYPDSIWAGTKSLKLKNEGPGTLSVTED